MNSFKGQLLAIFLVGSGALADPISSVRHRQVLFAQTTFNLTVGPSIRHLVQPNRQSMARAFPLGCLHRTSGRGFHLRSQIDIDDLQLAAFQVLWLHGLPCTIDWYYYSATVEIATFKQH